ncbi:MAG: UDP-3-O-(3-hydroxymyristoyl)glucosamine N-acyltransferase, partial [Rhodobacteraceae bacterium]|nr:UDP-3-O-(3-hydroxymyristoyl)glucosamine N-acyltransferase [Paracoccaceae bacterium]
SGRMVMGSPAVKIETHIEMYKALRRLPRLAKTVAALEKKLINPKG